MTVDNDGSLTSGMSPVIGHARPADVVHSRWCWPVQDRSSEAVGLAQMWALVHAVAALRTNPAGRPIPPRCGRARACPWRGRPAALAGSWRADSVGFVGGAARWPPCTPAVRPESDNGVVGARLLAGQQVQRWVRRFAATRGGSRLLSRLMPTLDRATLRVTGHRRCLTAIVAGLPVVQLTTIGARTGMPRTVSVLGFPTGQGVVVAGGNFGQRTEPAWCANLRRNPRARLAQGRLTRGVVAQELSGDARAAAWRQCLTVYPGGADYARRAAP